MLARCLLTAGYCTLPLLGGSTAAHPLDPLTADEIKAAVGMLRSEKLASFDTRFPLIKLSPPDKAAVWRWSAGQATPRRALVVMKDGRRTREALIDLGRRRVVAVTPRPNVQTTIVPEEWSRATALVKADPRWQAAMRARGIADFRGIFCDALSVGAFGRAERRRLLKVPCYDARATNNVYGRPIEGLMALVDIDAGTVVEVADRGAVAISAADPSLEQERQLRLQPPLRPVLTSTPGGFNFAIDGSLFHWAAWSFHLSFDQRVGPIISAVRYTDGDRVRPILYQGHASEMFVPYMDPDPGWSFRSYMDVGEYGFGSLASTLVAGSDCPAGATMLSATLPSHKGEPFVARDVICAFERNTTVPLWRRSEIVTGSREARQDVEFVLRTIPTVGNYDYVYDWVFNQKGEIRIDVGATGIAAAKGVSAGRADDPGADNPHGALVSPNLAAPYHDHFLSFRLDLDVDGVANFLIRERIIAETLPEGSARRSLWTRKSAIVARELGAEPGHAPELWRVENRSEKTALGYHPSFEIAGGHSVASVLSPNDPPQRRAAFSARPLWVTTYKPGELYAAGDYPNQSAGGEGLPRFVNGEPVDGKDLVVWYTMGFHHVTRPEDWPVLSTVRHSMTLRPHRFFTGNPALSVPRESGSAERKRSPASAPAEPRR